MNIIHGFVIFIILGIIQIKLDYTIEKCDNKIGRTIIMMHHFGNIYLIFGSLLFGFHLFHLFVVIFSFIVHKLYTNCPITIISNILCHDKNKKSIPLITFLNHITNLFGYDSIIVPYYSLLTIVILYDLFHVTKKYNK